MARRQAALHGKKTKSGKAPISPQERGRESREKGLNFEERVAEIYRLLHYDVEVGRIFSGRQVDLFLTGRFGDLTVQRAIECKLGPVNVADLDAFIAKLRLVRRDYPSAQGTLVSAVSFSDSVAAHAHQEGIVLTLFRDLSAQLLDGHQYAAQLIASCEKSERYPVRFYVEPSIGWEPSGESTPATRVLNDWLGDTSWNQLTLLGDVGTGKSFLCRMLAHDLGRAFLSNPLQNPLPLLIDLRNADRQFSLEGLILTHLSNSGLGRVSFDAFAHALNHGNIVLILDGFDEMSARVSPSVTVRNFHELAKCVNGQAKVILTCRTHYFKSRTEEEEVILGGGQDLASDSARELYWDLISRKGFRIAYLHPFSLLQIESYLQLRRPNDFRKALTKIRETYNLLELSQRPMLLEMIVKSLDKIEASDINPASLYRIYTDAWIQRDHWRDVLTAEKKLAFLTSLARTLWSEDTPRMHYSVLQEQLRQEFSSELLDPLRFVEIDSEVRTASFLTRNGAGEYEFAHKSYGEFFLARALADRLSRREVDCLRLRRLSPEVISFLFDLLDLAPLEADLEGILVREYIPMLSENALTVLYGLRRERWRRQRQRLQGEGVAAVQVNMPRGAMLAGANLHHLSLEGMVLKEAQLQGANFQDAILSYGDLSFSNLRHARFDSAVLSQVCFVGASLASCSLAAANLGNAKLDGCDLSSATITGAYMVGVSAGGVDWSEVKIGDAVFSDDLLAVVRSKKPLEAILGQARQSSSQVIDDLEALLPELRAHARMLSIRGSIEADDIVSEAVMSILELSYRSDGMQLTRDYLFSVVDRVGVTMLNRERRHWRLVHRGVADGGWDEDEAGEDTIAVLEGDDSLASVGETRVMVSEVSDADNPLDLLLVQEKYGLFLEAMAETERALSKRFGSVFRRYYVEGLSAARIAELEGASPRNIARMLVTIRQALARTLDQLKLQSQRDRARGSNEASSGLEPSRAWASHRETHDHN